MKPRASRFQNCTVLAASPTGRRIWRFDVAKDRLKPAGEFRIEPGKPLPKRVQSRDWQSLLQPRLNLAWLPVDSVFVRAVQLPSGDPAELPALVEFQLEKISPLPVNQIVWSALSVPQPDGRQQTALVTIAARDAVEQFLDRQVGDGYVVGQLDLPLVRSWRALKPAEDSLWLLFETALDRQHCLAGWFINGVWRDVTLFTVGPGPAGAAALTGQLGQIAWAGEMEGWFNGLPPVHVVGDPALFADFEPALDAWAGRPVVRHDPAAPAELAEASATAFLTPPAASLVPSDWAATQRQKFVDRIWIGGLGAIGLAYLAFLFLFLITLSVRKYQRDDLRSEVGAMGIQYTNTMQLKAQVGVLQDQVALRYAALESWQAVVDNLPASLTLTQLDFDKGLTLRLTGNVGADSTADVTKFNSELKKSQVNGQPLFASVKPAQITAGRGNTPTLWTFEAQLRRNEVP